MLHETTSPIQPMLPPAWPVKDWLKDERPIGTLMSLFSDLVGGHEAAAPLFGSTLSTFRNHLYGRAKAPEDQYRIIMHLRSKYELPGTSKQ